MAYKSNIRMKADRETQVVGVVVIGRNEGQRLVRCLRSLSEWMSALVYVDSGSTDGSVQVAESFGAAVVRLNSDFPFTAARARNEGLWALQDSMHCSLVQFVDGDCEVDPGWISTARSYLEKHHHVAVVAGRLREKHPERSLYNRFCAIEWNVPAGEVDAVGGIAMYRVQRFLSSGLFDSSLVAGEEPELCMRIRRSGDRVLRINAEMAVHDADALSFAQWWRRSHKSGYGSFDVVARASANEHQAGTPFLRMVRSVSRWTYVWVVVTVGLAIIGGLVPVPYGAVMGVLAGLSLWVAQAIRIAWSVRSRCKDWRTRFAYGVFTLIGKWAQLAGHRACRSNLRVVSRNRTAARSGVS